MGFKMRCGQRAFNPWHVRKVNAGDILQIHVVKVDPTRKRLVFCSVFSSPGKSPEVVKYYTLPNSSFDHFAEEKKILYHSENRHTKLDTNRQKWTQSDKICQDRHYQIKVDPLGQK